MSIDTRLSYDDLLWIIKAADAWEAAESSEFYMAKEILSIPEMDEEAAMQAGLPPEALHFIERLKGKYRGKEQNLADKRDGVAEQAATMKAKLYYLKRQLGMAGLLDVEEGAVVKDGESTPLPTPDPPKKPSPLQAKLAEAIRKEDYDRAAEIRDQIKSEESSDSED
jgi:hypothetical protein